MEVMMLKDKLNSFLDSDEEKTVDDLFVRMV
jgi:hypothetical protein